MKLVQDASYKNTVFGYQIARDDHFLHLFPVTLIEFVCNTKTLTFAFLLLSFFPSCCCF